MSVCSLCAALSLLLGSCFVDFESVAVAQSVNEGDEKSKSPLELEPGKPEPPGKVEVEPAARDDQIRQRLRDILHTTRWFENAEVTVKDGIVFLQGETENEQYKKWAGDLARNTEGVVAVVNRIDVVSKTVWDFTPAWQELQSLGRGLVRALPLIVLALIVLAFAWAGARLTARLLRRLQRPRFRSHLLGEVISRACGILVFVLGLYFVLRVSGLTRLAVSVIGGTGLIGLVVGIAFRDITENFLASLLLSLQQPFREGDLVEIAGTTGYIQRLNSRTTVLMTLDGNQVQIPNATVFKSTIRNYSSNANRREDFAVGIGYGDPIPRAQEVALKVLADHPAVLKDPEPWVLVDNLAAATVNLRVYFWLDGSRHSWLKVKSSVIRLIKRSFQDAGISLPDESREVIFPDGVPIRVLKGDGHRTDGRPVHPSHPTTEPEAVSTEAEAGLQSEAKAIEEQARQAWSPDRGENLLPAAASNSSSSNGSANDPVS